MLVHVKAHLQRRGLIWLGIALALISSISIVLQRSLIWHSQRDLELNATYKAFLQTGVLLIKATGSGSYNVQAPTNGEWASAAWDDDPGAYIIASLMGLITHSASPYPGLTIAVALLVAVPLIWLPTTVARLFRSRRAGYALIALPFVMWLTNNGTIAAGTQYGASDIVSITPVYALYGLTSSLVFFGLSLVLLLTTFKLKTNVLVLISLGFVLFAAVSNLTRSLSGFCVVLAVAVIWWLNTRGSWKRRFVIVAASIVAMVALTITAQSAAMQLLNQERAAATQQRMEDLPDAHGTWHPLYLGLAWPTPVTGQASAFDVKWDDLFGWEKARDVDPNVVIGGKEYDAILKNYYVDAVSAHPIDAVKLYVGKFFYVVQHFAGMIVLIAIAGLLSVLQRPRLRRNYSVGLAVATPAIILGLIPPVLVMPMLYYYSELTAALSLLIAVSLGAIAMRLDWSMLRKSGSKVRLSE